MCLSSPFNWLNPTDKPCLRVDDSIFDCPSSEDMLGSYIPCVLLQKESNFLLLYCHGNEVDLGGCITFLRALSNCIGVSILAVEYPGYGLLKSRTASSEAVTNAVHKVFCYVCKDMGWQANRCVLIGRSIGSGPASHIASLHPVMIEHYSTAHSRHIHVHQFCYCHRHHHHRYLASHPRTLGVLFSYRRSFQFEN